MNDEFDDLPVSRYYEIVHLAIKNLVRLEGTRLHPNTELRGPIQPPP